MKTTGVRLAIVAIGVMILAQTAWAGRDLTFVNWTDLHYGAYDYSDTTRLQTLNDINNLVNTSYPASLKLGKVGKPSFLMCLGDITEHGYASEWNSPSLGHQRSYVQTLTHLNSGIRTYETMGNHDGKTQEIRNAITAKQGNTYYSFNDQGVHFVVLDPYKKASIQYPDLDDQQLTWLQSDLNKLAPQTPIILTMHIFPDSTSGDRTCHLGATSSQKLANILNDKNVLAIMHGHGHYYGHMTWNGIDVLASGFCYMRSGCPSGSPTFQVVKITDNHMYALEYNWYSNTWQTTLVNKAIVPEPLTLAHLGAAGVGLILRRRKVA